MCGVGLGLGLGWVRVIVACGEEKGPSDVHYIVNY